MSLLFMYVTTWPCVCVCVCVCARVLSRFSHVQLFATPWTVAHQAPQSLEFSRQEYWSGLPVAPPGKSSWPRDQINFSYVSCISRQVLHLHHLGSPILLVRCRLFKGRGLVKIMNSRWRGSLEVILEATYHNTQNVEQKKPDNQKYILCDSMYTKFKK